MTRYATMQRPEPLRPVPIAATVLAAASGGMAGLGTRGGRRGDLIKIV
jgi:hypothetical protein